MTEGLHGKVCVVTGASSGIGEATARRLAAAGMHLAIGARREDRLTALSKELESAGARVFAKKTDVTDEGEAHALVEETKAELGRVDILVNNAGVMLLGPIEGADTSEWRRMVEVNLLGLFYCTHAAVPLMREQGGGDIVNISSVAGRVARAGAGVYNATKFGVGAFSEALRQEVLRANIRVSVIEPGAVATELASHVTHPLGRAAIEQMRKEMKAPLQAQDIAEAIFYAISQPQHVSVNEVLIRPTEQSR
jgi:NADP-dependent 3-hydroxy acid dehydrogenase YdfG